jgi:hypothetical protein
MNKILSNIVLGALVAIAGVMLGSKIGVKCK